MLGSIAMRVVSGPGGIDKGSMVSVVREVKKQRCSSEDNEAPGVILANTGSLWWWPEGRMALDYRRRSAVPMESAVHWRRKHSNKLNSIPENENVDRHVQYIFDKVIPQLTKSDARIDVIGIGDGGEVVEAFLNVEENWARHEHRLNAMALLGGSFHSSNLHVDGFKDFLRNVSFLLRFFSCDTEHFSLTSSMSNMFRYLMARISNIKDSELERI